MEVINVLNDYAGAHRDNLEPTTVALFASKINDTIVKSDSDMPVDVVLAGFPYKSPNAAERVMGDSPDFGEWAALRRLAQFRGSLANAIDRDVHVIICSDGHVFNDLKSIPDQKVDRYRESVKGMAALQGEGLFVQGLDSYLDSSGTGAQREEFLERYVCTREEIIEALEQDSSLQLLHLNLSIFARHDLTRMEGESKRDYKKRCSDTALDILARSIGWSRLIKTAHPDAIRMSVHPYTDVSDKFPIELAKSVDGRWRTPWHNVPIVRPGRKDPLLAPKSYAEGMGMHTIDRTNRVIGKSNQNTPWAYVDSLC
jgi:pyoverdine/dityrosine biosynthesis protein Dit1